MADALATLLVQEGAVSLEAVVRAQARQREAGGGLDTALLELGLVGEERLTAVLSRASGLPVAAPAALADPDPRSRRVFPAKVAERHGLAPYALEGKELHLLASWPVDPAALDEIGFMLSLALVPHVAPELRVRELRQRVYAIPLPERFAALSARLDAGAPPAPPVDPARPGVAAATREATGPRRAPAPPPGPAPPPRPPRWDLEEARAALAAAGGRHEVVAVALRYARDFFEHAAILAVSRHGLAGHDALSDDPRARALVRGVAVPAAEGGIFRAVLDSRGPYLGPPGPDAALDAVVRAMGRASPRTVLLYPVPVRDRVVCLLYADNGEAPVSPRRVGDLLLLAGALGPAFERILREGKRAPRPAPPAGAPGPDAGAPAAAAPGPAPRPAAAQEPAAPLPPPGPRDAGGWEVTEPARRELPALPLSAVAELDLGEYEVAPAAEALLAPPPFEPAEAVRRLAASAPGSAERGRLVALLVQHGPEAAEELARALPGPLDPAAAADEEAVPADERGPVSIALAALGIVATPFLLPLLADADPARRRAAAALLGHSGDPAAFLSLAEAALDPDPGAAGAALAALAARRDHPDFGPVLERLRRALRDEPPAPAAAARALARLGDAAAVPQLQALLAGDAAGAAAAAAALAELGARGTPA